MANKIYEETSVQNIANSIRNKNKTSNTYKVSQMSSAIDLLKVLHENEQTAYPLNIKGIGNLKDYKIDGNSYQDSTSGKNWFNPNNVQRENNSTLEKTVTGFNVTRIHNSGYGDEFIASYTIENLKPNTTYTFNLNFESENSFTNGSLYVYSDQLFGTALTKSNYQEDNNNRKWNITTNSTGEMVIGFYGGTSTQNKIFKFTNIQLEEGPTATNFEPYTGGNPSPSPDFPQEIISLGDYDEETDKYKINVESRGKNYIKLSDCETSQFKIENNIVNSLTSGSSHYTNYLDNNGILHRGTANYVDFEPQNIERQYCKLRAGTYYFSRICDVNGIQLYFVDEEYANSNYYFQNVPSENKKSLVGNGVVTLDHDMYLYVWFIVRPTMFTISNMQLENGNSVSSYEPYKQPIITPIYLNEPLRKIGNLKDHIDFANKKVVRNIGEVVLDGSEDENIIKFIDNKNCYGIPINNIKMNQDTSQISNILCSHFIKNSQVNIFNNNIEGIAIWNWGNYIGITNNSTTTLNEFKTWLSTHNVIVDFELATPIEEPINLPDIPLFNDITTIIETENELQPSSMYAKYWEVV